MSVNENLILANKLYRCINDKSVNEALDIISDDFVIENKALNITIRGKEGFQSSMNFWITAFPDLSIEIKNMIAGEKDVVTELLVNGTHTGVPQTPDGIVEPTGKYINVPFCEILHIEDGFIRDTHFYFNIGSMMDQLGLIPAKVSQN